MQGGGSGTNLFTNHGGIHLAYNSTIKLACLLMRQLALHIHIIQMSVLVMGLLG
ncbi:hypothetical protein ACTVJV_002589 [Proteus mirabilis]